MLEMLLILLKHFFISARDSGFHEKAAISPARYAAFPASFFLLVSSDAI